MLKRGMIPGAAGMLVVMAALLWGAGAGQRWLFLIGVIGMTITAIFERHGLYIGLQLVVIAGALAAFLPLSSTARSLVPLAVGVPVIAVLAIRRELGTRSAWLGAVGLAALGVGYAVQHPLGFVLGGALISVFSAVEFRRGFKPALIWLTLNVLFTVLAAVRLVALRVISP